MLHVYWGGSNSGKAHLIKYATLNSKSLLKFKQYQIIKRDFDCRECDYDINDRLWWHVVEDCSVYHKRKDENNVRVSKFTNDTVGPTHCVPTLQNYSSPGKTDIADTKWERNPNGMYKKSQYVKYMGKEYIDTTIYNKMVATNHVGRSLDKIVDHKDKFDIDEISENTDLLFLFSHAFDDDDFTDDTLYYANHFKNAKHIVPYKENLIDSIASKLDGVADEGGKLGLVDMNLMDLAMRNKEKLWQYIDSYFEYDKNTIKLLERLNIDYIKFNLDSNAYVETFGWDKYPFKKDFTHICDTFTDQKQFDRWEDCVRLAKAYLYDRKL